MFIKLEDLPAYCRPTSRPCKGSDTIRPNFSLSLSPLKTRFFCLYNDDSHSLSLALYIGLRLLSVFINVKVSIGLKML